MIMVFVVILSLRFDLRVGHLLYEREWEQVMLLVRRHMTFATRVKLLLQVARVGNMTCILFFTLLKVSRCVWIIAQPLDEI